MELKFENLLGFDSVYLFSAYYIVHYGSTYVEQYNARSKRLKRERARYSSEEALESVCCLLVLV